MKTPILVSKIRANTTGLVQVDYYRSIATRNKPTHIFLLPVTDAARSEFDPTTTEYNYDYHVTSRLNKFIKEHNIRVPNYSSVHCKIIPVDEMPPCRMI